MKLLKDLTKYQWPRLKKLIINLNIDPFVFIADMKVYNQL